LVQIPIYNLESSDASFPISISLSYHPYNALENNPGVVGLGWSYLSEEVLVDGYR
jgi:hypothetical protein